MIQREPPERSSAKDPVASRPRAAVDGLPSSLLALQRRAGNRAVTAFVARAAEGSTRLGAQRVPVTNAAGGETLYNTSNSSGQAAAQPYGVNARNYDMTRVGDTGVTITTKIKFLSQARNTVPPPPGAPPGTPQLGQHIGPQTEIPAADPRRAWATTTAAAGVAHWNNRLTLVGEEVNVFSANTKKRLAVTFNSVAVFGLTDPADQTVIVYGPATVGGSPGNPIDAGDFYMNKNNSVYPATDDVIYAHEYGHMLGIPDEYSQSNAQMNALMHQAAPASAASAGAALDRATIERMALAALARPLYGQLNAAIGPVTAALRAQRALVTTKMAGAARAGAASTSVRDELTAELTAASEPTLSPSIPGAVAFETTANFSARDRAAAGVEEGFAAAALTTQITNAYFAALLKPNATPVAVAGIGDVSINVASSTYGLAGAGTPIAGAAAGEASTVVGPAGGPGLPAVPPAASLVGQIAAIPATWSAAGSTLEAGVTPTAFATKMQSALKSAGAAAAPPPGVAPPPKMRRAGALWQRALALVTNSSKEAAKQLAADLVTAAVGPVLASSVAALQTTIQAEVARITTTPPAGVAAAGPTDPQMAAVVAAMKAQLDAAKAATAGSGRDPLNTGGTAPAQDVTYSYQGLMGSNATTELRPDQFAGVASDFNSKLKKTFEKSFTPEVK